MIVNITRPTNPQARSASDFTSFVESAEPRLRRALAGALGIDGAPDAVAEALAWAWENWARVETMDNPVGYLYRVARSSARVRTPQRVRYLAQAPTELPHVEPALPDAIRALPPQQRTTVWLLYACEWSYAEVADALDISASAVGTHASRGLASLRSTLGEAHA